MIAETEYFPENWVELMGPWMKAVDDECFTMIKVNGEDGPILVPLIEIESKGVFHLGTGKLMQDVEGRL